MPDLSSNLGKLAKYLASYMHAVVVVVVVVVIVLYTYHQLRPKYMRE